MPVSAYLKAGFFVVAAAAALFAAAGTVAIPGFWAYLAILSWRAIRITPRGSDGGFSRAFGECQTSLRQFRCWHFETTLVGSPYMEIAGHGEPT